MMLKETSNAVLDWKGKMQATERYPKDQYIWDIKYTLVTLDKKDTFDFSKCDVIIRFERTPTNEEEMYKTIGVTQVGEFPTPITIYYLDITTCVRKESDANYYYTYYDLCYSDKPITENQVGTTVRHEFGHALGLGHYVSPDDRVNENWAKGTSSPPSLMVIFSNENKKLNHITPLDVETVVSIYGEDGFLSDVADKPESANIVNTKPEPKQPIVDISTEGWSETIDDEGYSIKYPPGWASESSNLDPITNPGLYDMIYSFLTLYDKTEGWVSRFEVKYIENDKLASDNQGANYLDALIDILKEDCKMSSFDNGGFTCKNHSIIDSKIIQINGRQAYQVVESYAETYPDQTSYDTTRVLTDIPSGNNVWSLDSITDSSEYPKFASLIQATVNSFQLLETEENVNASSNTVIISDWIRNNAEWWSKNQISDQDFTLGLKYLIQEGIIRVPEGTATEGQAEPEIPSWLRNNAGWWSQGLLSDDEFLKSVQWMINNGFIKV